MPLSNLKTDNANFAVKIEMRLGAMRATGWREFGVLDLCAGASKIWTAVNAEMPLSRYLACDRKPRSAMVLKGDAEDLAQTIDLALFNVIDIDAYGEPWGALTHVVRRVTSPTLIFLTQGIMATTFNPSFAIRRASGIPDEWSLPPSRDLVLYLSDRAFRGVLAYGTVSDALYFEKKTARYWAFLFTPTAKTLVDKRPRLVKSAGESSSGTRTRPHVRSPHRRRVTNG